jgi:phage tail-like protein
MVRLSSSAALSKKFFRVRIDDVPELSFQSVEGLGEEIEVGEYRDGTEQNITYKVGNYTVDDLTLKYGESLGSLQPLYNWARQCLKAKENGGLVGEELERNVDVIVENEAGQQVFLVRNTGCLVQRFELDPRDGTTSDVAVDTLVLKVTDRDIVFGASPG